MNYSNEVNKLIDLILQWWQKHQYDVINIDEDEVNMYDEEPDFVKQAKLIRSFYE